MDGKGAKEKVKLTVDNEKTTEGGFASTVTLIINGKEIFKNSYNTEWSEPKVELAVTDIKTKEKRVTNIRIYF